MNCVFYDNMRPNGFEENFFFSSDMPYTLYVRQFQTDETVPLHYAKTIEVLVCNGLKGEIVVGSKRYSMCGQQVFVIPPYTVHSTTIQACDGVEYIFKVSFKDIENYFNIPNFLSVCGSRLDQLEYVCDEYSGVMDCIKHLIDNDGNLGVCLYNVLQLFLLFSKHTDTKRQSTQESSKLHSSSLQDIIKWTQQNYMNKISLDDVAKLTGYSKYHFCRRFKEMTGVTYIDYLNSVRVTNSALLLLEGLTVQEVCIKCGIENASYFTQLFKKIQHVTPHQYVESFSRQRSMHYE